MASTKFNLKKNYALYKKVNQLLSTKLIEITLDA